MYATGIGLVLKGFEDLEKSAISKPAGTGEVKTHSEKTRGSFFDSIVKKSKHWFAEED